MTSVTAPRTKTVRLAAAALIAGTALYVVPTAVHGNPPIESAQAMLTFVHDRPAWRVLHLANILAVLLWAAATVVLAPVLAPTQPALRQVHQLVFTSATAIFAIYFSIHSFGLPRAADQFFGVGADRAAILERAEAVMIVLGSTAFTGQAVLGAAIALTGVVCARSAALPRWLSLIGVVAGVGWLTGALMIDFAVIVPFTVMTWAWTVAVAIVLLRRYCR